MTRGGINLKTCRDPAGRNAAKENAKYRSDDLKRRRGGLDRPKQSNDLLGKGEKQNV